MDSEQLGHIERSVRLAYEWGRVRRALLGFAPSLLLVALGMQFTTDARWTLVFGCAMFVGGVLLLWYGQEPRRAVLPGLLAGIVPMTLALCAKQMGHVCGGEACTLVCLPTCALGGGVAGLIVAMIGKRRRRGPGFWIGAAAMAFSTGAMGCACVGYFGLIGLVLGYAAGSAPVLALAWLRRR